MSKIRLWKLASLSVGAPVGDLEGGSFTGDPETQMKEGSGYRAPLSTALLRGEPGGRAPLRGALKGM